MTWELSCKSSFLRITTHQTIHPISLFLLAFFLLFSAIRLDFPLHAIPFSQSPIRNGYWSDEAPHEGWTDSKNFIWSDTFLIESILNKEKVQGK